MSGSVVVFPKPARPAPWWSTAEARRQLIDLATKEWADETKDIGGIFVYNTAKLHDMATSLMQLKNVSKVFFAIKANSNPTILKILNNIGINFECVSIQELRLILTTFPNIAPDRILFTPNFASKVEITRALKMLDDHAKGYAAANAGTNFSSFITVDNYWVIREWSDLFTGRNIMLRVDPGEDGHGHHAHVHTGSSSKFGIEAEIVQSSEFSTLISSKGINIVGLHMHKGSGILDAAQWYRSAKLLASLRTAFPSLRHVDMGGGLGVPYKPTDTPLDLNKVDVLLEPVKAEHPDLELWLEPGRYIVAECGVMLVQVTQLKSKGPHRFVGVSAGMNHLIRPALYESYHHIVNLTKFRDNYLSAPKVVDDGKDTESEAKDQNANITGKLSLDFICSESASASEDTILVSVVGPICETGDFLGHNRFFPSSTNEGDIVAVDVAGAYGRVMSNEYNLRGPGPELFVDIQQ